MKQNNWRTIFMSSDGNHRNNGNEGEGEEESSIITARKVKVKRPSLYRVLLHNDDYTTMEFVIYVLQKHFHKSAEEAQSIMLKVHKDGVGTCGVYTHEVAETKASKVAREARENGHPLKCSIEPE